MNKYFLVLTSFLLITIQGFSQKTTLSNTAKAVEIKPSGIRYTQVQNTYDSTNVAAGNGSLSSLTVGTANTVIGDSNAVQLSSGIANTLIGSNIMKNTSSGAERNIVVGASAAEQWQGLNLIALGLGSAGDHVNVAQSINIGAFAGLNGTAGNHIAIGTGAGLAARKQFNIFLGSGVGLNLQNTEKSILIGGGAGGGTANSGNLNELLVGIGFESFKENGKSDESIGIGYRTFANNNGSLTNSFFRSVAIGYEALENLERNTGNIAIGKHSLRHLDEGIDNVAIGDESLYAITGLSEHNVAIGTKAGGNSGINGSGEGFTSASANILIGYQAGRTNSFTGSFGQNVAVGSNALINLTGNPGNIVALGAYAGDNSGQGFNNTFIGAYTGHGSNLPYFNSTAIGFEAKITSNNMVVFGNSNVTLVEGNVAWTNFSDKRLKKNITYDGSLGLDLINSLKPAYFTYKSSSSRRQNLGIIADDLEDYLVKTGNTFSALRYGSGAKKYKSVAYAELCLPLINAIQELDQKINTKDEWVPLELANIENQITNK